MELGYDLSSNNSWNETCLEGKARERLPWDTDDVEKERRPSLFGDKKTARKARKNTLEHRKASLHSLHFILDEDTEMHIRPHQMPCPKSRRTSLPNKSTRKEKQQASENSLKKVRSTPHGFAPLCVMASGDSRCLHSCTSHSYMPHLNEKNRRRMSCPAELIDPMLCGSSPSRKPKKRRKSFPISRPEMNERRDERLHRCKGHFATSSINQSHNEGLRKSVSLTADPVLLRTGSVLLTDESGTDMSFPIEDINPIARSVDLLDAWTAHVLGDTLSCPRISLLRKRDPLSNQSSLNSISEE